MRVERVPHREHNVQTEEQVEGKGAKLEELLDVEVGGGHVLDHGSWIGLPPCGANVQLVQLEVANDPPGTQL